MAILSGSGYSEEDTIVAPATVAGAAAIHIVRLSGPQTAIIVEALCGLPATAFAPRCLRRVRLHDQAHGLLDEALLVRFFAPQSYTGQDIAELHLHGAPQVVHSVLRACQRLGARLAQPGEFTYRAWLFGKLDLMQAEAVADLLAARGDVEVSAAARLLRGELSHEVRAVLDRLEALVCGWRAAMDFPDYDTGEGVQASDLCTLAACASDVQRLRDACAVRATHGHTVALCGPPNAGKSTLLNALAGDERVLVDATPGTTRDSVEVRLALRGHTLTLVDTAGLRDGGDALERRGMALSRRHAARAAMVLWLAPADAPTLPPADLPVDALVLSKADLQGAQTRDALVRRATAAGIVCLGEVSAHDGHSLSRLASRLLQHVSGDVAHAQARFWVRQRHIESLRRAAQGLEAAQQAFAAHAALDLLALDVERAAATLGEILGRDVDAAVLDEIFARFCIGK